jgi:hypothetical protein
MRKKKLLISLLFYSNSYVRHLREFFSVLDSTEMGFDEITKTRISLCVDDQNKFILGVINSRLFINFYLRNQCNLFV